MRYMSYGQETKSVSKSVRMTPRVHKAIEDYRGEGFNEKLANLVTDFLDHRDELQQDWERLNAAVADKHTELKQVQARLRKVRDIETRLQPLVDAVLDLIKEP